MRVKQTWVLALGFSLLVSAPVWAHSNRGETAGGKQMREHRDSSIQLATTKRPELSVPSQKLADGHPALSTKIHEKKTHSSHARMHGKPHAKKAKSHRFVGGLPHGLQKKLGEIPLQGNLPRVNPSVEAAIPIPEPSALLFFGVGLVVARRAIGRARR